MIAPLVYPDDPWKQRVFRATYLSMRSKPEYIDFTDEALAEIIRKVFDRIDNPAFRLSCIPLNLN